MTASLSPSSRSGRRGVQVASTAAGAVLAVAAAAFVGRAIVRDRAEIANALGGASLGWLVLAAVLAAAGMVAIALPWRRAIRLLGADLAPAQVLSRYFVGELGKYLPGGVWPVLGRGEMARRAGVRAAAAYGSVLLSLLALYLAATLVVIAGLPVLVSGDDTGPVAVLVLLPVGLGLLHPRVLRWVVAMVGRIGRRSVVLEVPAWRSSVALVARYVPAWLAIGGATWAVARSLDPGAQLAEVGTAAVLSWLVGFVLVPVPGGVGVREAAFVAAAGSLDPGIAAAAAVGARALFVVVDVVGALFGAAAVRSWKRSTGPPT